MEAPVCGWYPDPSGRHASRYWDGAAWTGRVRDADVPHVEVAVGASDLARQAVREYLADAFARGVMSAATREALNDDVDRWEPGRAPPAHAPGPVRPPPAYAPGAAPPAPVPRPVYAATPAPSPSADARPALPPPPVSPPGPRRPPPPRYAPAPPFVPPRAPGPGPQPPRPPAPAPTPSALATWWDRRRRAISADLAVHGLSYLGVLLVFAGVFGFVVFAFGEVRTGLRPLAELAIPIVLFAAAAFLRHRGAPFVSSAMEFLGGAVLPIAAIASMADGAGVPPDLTGGSLVVALVVVDLLLAAAYAIVSRRRPDSPLRFLVGPMVWLAVACGGLALAPQTPGGRDLSQPVPGQWALVAVAVTLSLVWCRARPDARLARPTVTAAIPAVALAEVVAVLASPGRDWPLVPLAIVGAATLVSLELLAPPLRGRTLTALQGVVVAVTAATLAPSAGLAWAAVVGSLALLALTEWQGWRRVDVVATHVLLAGAATAALFALDQPWPTLVVAAVGSVWAVGRRIRPIEGLDAAVPAAAVFVLPLGAATAAFRLLSFDVALVVLASTVVAVAVVARLSPARRDRVASAWVLVNAALVVAGTLSGREARPAALAVAAALATASFLLAPRWPLLRVWLATAGGVVALAWIGVAADLSAASTCLVVAGFGTASVLGSLVRRTAVAGHAGLAGLVTSAGALAVAVWEPATAPGPDGPWSASSATVLALVTVSWLAIAVAGAWRGCAADDLLLVVVEQGPPEPGRSSVLAPVVAVAAAAVLGPAALAASGALAWSDPWAPVVGAGVALAAALVADAVRHVRPRVASVVGGEALVIALAAGALASSGYWAASVGWGLVVVTAVAVGRVVRHPLVAWVGWAASVPALLFGAHAAGVAPGSLHLVLLGWGVVALVGGLALDDALAGRRRAGEGVRRAALVPGCVLGAFAVPMGYLPLLGEAHSALGWWSLGVAGVAFVVAAQLRWGLLSAVGWGLATVAYVALAPWEPLSLPWTLVPVVAALLVASEVASVVAPAAGYSPLGPPRPDLPPPPRGALGSGPRLDPAVARWDVAPFLVAHVVAAFALAAALDAGWLPATWISTGMLGLGVAVRLRRWAWAIGGSLLVLVGAGAIGPAWLALALAILAVAATALAARTEGPARSALQLTGAVAAGAAWATTAVWLGWSTEELVTLTAVVSGAILLVLGAAARWSRLGQDWLRVWVLVPACGLVTALFGLLDPSVPRSPAGPATAGALGALALASGLSARRLRLPWLRDLAAVAVAGGFAVLAYGVEAPPATSVAVAAAIGIVASAAEVVVATTGWALAWRRAVLVLATLATAAALGLALNELPDRSLLVASLLVAGVELLGVGVATRHIGALLGAPVAFVAAWLAFASEALTGDPQWFTVPIGLTVLVMVGLARWDRRRAGRDRADPLLGLIDVIGMVLVVSAALVQTVTVSPAYGLAALAGGLGLSVFGVVTQVRRRLAVGAATIVLAVVLMVVPPLVELVPAFTGWVPWALLAAVGLAAMMIAAFLEQGRQAVRRARVRLGELTAGWE